MGLSSDPLKKRRQLEALANGAERRAASLRARIADIDASTEDVNEAASEASAAPAATASEARSEASSEAPAGFVVGSYDEPPAPPAPAEHDRQVDELELEPEDDLEHDAPEEPGGLLRFAAGALGVQKR